MSLPVVFLLWPFLFGLFQNPSPILSAHVDGSSLVLNDPTLGDDGIDEVRGRDVECRADIGGSQSAPSHSIPPRQDRRRNSLVALRVVERADAVRSDLDLSEADGGTLLGGRAVEGDEPTRDGGELAGGPLLNGDAKCDFGQSRAWSDARQRKDIPRAVSDRDVNGRLGSNDNHLDAVTLGEDGGVVSSNLEESGALVRTRLASTQNETSRTLLAVSPLRTTRSAPTTTASIWWCWKREPTMVSAIRVEGI